MLLVKALRLMNANKQEGDSGGGGDIENPAARQEIERRAKDMGWAPRDQWRGAPERWIDADVFVRRGEEIMPILQANNRKEQARIQKLETELQASRAQLAAAQESIQVLTNVYDQTSLDTAKQKRKELLRQQAEARTAQNSELEVELGEQIADQTALIRDAETKGIGKDKDKGKGRTADNSASASAPASSNNNPASNPEFTSWNADNPWFGTDIRKTALATEIAKEIRNNPANAHLQGRAFFDKVAEETDAYLGQGSSSDRRGSKVEGGAGNGSGSGSGSGSGGSNGSGSGGGERTYNSLPEDAKAACTRQAQWVVGKGRAFADIAAWRKHYTQMYYNS